MTEKPADIVQLLKSNKPKLINILRADADFFLQFAHALDLLSNQGYEQIKSCSVPSEKVRDILDHVISRGPKKAQGLLDLLKENEMQETFPMLDFIKELHVQELLSVEELQAPIPAKMACSNGCDPVKEKQLMLVAQRLGSSWREIGRLALDIPNVKLEQIEEEKRMHVERVFAMLLYWRNQKREKATASYLHSLLSLKDLSVPSESIDFLLEAD